MKHILNVLMIICFSITTIIYVSHLTQTEKIVDSSSNNKIRIDSTIFFNYSISLIKLNKNAINTLVRIYDIKKDIQISDVNIYLNDSEYNIVSINTEKTGYLYMTYSEYSTIPDSLRILNKNGFQNIIFKFEGNDSAKNIINLKLSLITKDTKYLLSDNREYKIISEIQFKPWDAHSDLTILLMPIMGIFGLFVLIIRILIYSFNKRK